MFGLFCGTCYLINLILAVVVIAYEQENLNAAKVKKKIKIKIKKFHWVKKKIFFKNQRI